MKPQNKILFLLIILFSALTFAGSSIPFFWDGTFFSFTALEFYSKGFHGFIAPLDGDSGGFPLFPGLMALAWKFFGKSIFISHLVILPFLFGIANEYLKLGRRFLSEKMLLFLALLLMVEPVFLTQSLLMGYDILLVFFFLLSLNYLLDKKEVKFSLILILLCAASIRGITLAFSLLVIDYFLSGISFRSLKKYIPAVSALIFWTIYHYSVTGWYLISPLREDTHESLLPPTMIIRQLLFIGWKLADFGRIILWLFLIFMIIRHKQNYVDHSRELLIVFFSPLIISVSFMAPLGNPIGHKYFIVIFLMLNIAVCYFLQYVTTTQRNIIAVALTLAMISGNFWIYPERFGNGWDSSLKVLPYFKLRSEMDQYVVDNNIDPHKIGTQYPLIADKKYSELSDISFAYTNVWAGPINDFEYFLQSNVINTDIPEQVEKVKSEWAVLKHLKRGQINLTLYKNPHFYSSQ
jgi:hypothetical protein